MPSDAAFDTIVEKYKDRIMNLAFRMLGSRSEAEDAAQETFIRAFRAYSRFRGESSTYTWLYRIATNLCLDTIRARNRAPQSESLDALGDPARGADDSGGSPEESLNRRELARAIRIALGELSPAHRAAVVLHDVEGLRYHEVARVLGCSVGTVKSRLFYGRRRLREILAEFLPGGGDLGGGWNMPRPD
ncbi:MAG: sigma-70 family RNA polymerase sigma factor [Firmicutes bacterium]|jgi:RNA polymerase sigma-70 factor (ECF subfamily)|nr:sigma-70 family RNA polymerase sigma factor [Bacillota bacterium]